MSCLAVMPTLSWPGADQLTVFQIWQQLTLWWKSWTHTKCCDCDCASWCHCPLLMDMTITITNYWALYCHNIVKRPLASSLSHQSFPKAGVNVITCGREKFKVGGKNLKKCVAFWTIRCFMSHLILHPPKDYVFTRIFFLVGLSAELCKISMKLGWRMDLCPEYPILTFGADPDKGQFRKFSLTSLNIFRFFFFITSLGNNALIFWHI